MHLNHARKKKKKLSCTNQKKENNTKKGISIIKLGTMMTLDTGYQRDNLEWLL